jgi:hypothetical protein
VGHHIQGFVVASSLAPALAEVLGAAVEVPLNGGFTFIPLTDRVYDGLSERFPGANAPVRSEFWKLSPAAERAAVEVSGRGAVAYVETEYFGGVGDQAAIVWSAGHVVMVRRAHGGPINKALAALGVSRSLVRDEFDVVGLGVHRGMDWNDPE